jgi:hypothetical protein
MLTHDPSAIAGKASDKPTSRYLVRDGCGGVDLGLEVGERNDELERIVEE